MTRVLYWNIQQFSDNTLAAHRTFRDNGRLRRVADTRRRDLILFHFSQALGGLGGRPDIIVVVEVSTGNRLPNQLITQGGGGWNGLNTILQFLRNTDAAGNWNLVPPIVVGQPNVCEGVGVFYKSSSLGLQRFFTGPNRFSAASLSFDPVANPGIAAAPYPGGIPFFVPPPGGGVPPPARTVPAGALFNAPAGGVNILENQCAARAEFVSLVGIGGVGGNVNFGGFREPYMFTFFETGGGAPDRNITIFAAHSPANYVGARNHIHLFADCAPIAQANFAGGGGVAPETKMIVGDFNIGLFWNNGTQTTAYNPLINGAVAPGTGVLAGGNYSLLLHADPAVSQLNGVFKGYYATHMKPAKKARFRSIVNTTRYYPGFGYIGSDRNRSLYSIDNVMVRAPGGGAGGAVLSILNSVTGSPFARRPWDRPVGAPSVAPPMSPGPWVSDMNNTPPLQPAPSVSAPRGPARSNTNWNDYGHIYAASDHLALATDL